MYWSGRELESLWEELILKGSTVRKAVNDDWMITEIQIYQEFHKFFADFGHAMLFPEEILDRWDVSESYQPENGKIGLMENWTTR